MIEITGKGRSFAIFIHLILCVCLCSIGCAKINNLKVRPVLSSYDVGSDSLRINDRNFNEEVASTKHVSQMLLSKTVEMSLPMPFRTQNEKIDEGVFYVYSFVDSTYIIVFEGAMMYFDIDDYIPDKVYYINERVVAVGVKNDKYWRRDVTGRVRVYYNNVSFNKKSFYDDILDSIIVKSL